MSETKKTEAPTVAPVTEEFRKRLTAYADSFAGVTKSARDLAPSFIATFRAFEARGDYEKYLGHKPGFYDFCRAIIPSLPDTRDGIMMDKRYMALENLKRLGMAAERHAANESLLKEAKKASPAVAAKVEKAIDAAIATAREAKEGRSAAVIEKAEEQARAKVLAAHVVDGKLVGKVSLPTKVETAEEREKRLLASFAAQLSDKPTSTDEGEGESPRETFLSLYEASLVRESHLTEEAAARIIGEATKAKPYKGLARVIVALEDVDETQDTDTASSPQQKTA